MGPTVIAVALMILVIGIGWLNHSGDDFVDSSSPLGRELIEAQADQANDGADIPAAGAALPGSLGGEAATGTDGGTTGTTLPPSVLDILLGEPTVTGTGSGSAAGAGPTSSTGSSGSTGSTGSGSSGTTSPSSPGTQPPTTGGSSPTTEGTVPPTSETTAPPTSDTTSETTLPPPIEDAGLLDVVGGLLGGVVGVLS
jgi:hypothetical protein